MVEDTEDLNRVGISREAMVEAISRLMDSRIEEDGAAEEDKGVVRRSKQFSGCCSMFSSRLVVHAIVSESFLHLSTDLGASSALRLLPSLVFAHFVAGNMEEEGNSTPRPSKTRMIPDLGYALPNPLSFDPQQSSSQPGPSNLSSRVPSTASSAAGSVVTSALPRKPLTRRQQLLQRARAHENAGSPLSGVGSEALQAKDPRIKEVSYSLSC